MKYKSIYLSFLLLFVHLYLAGQQMSVVVNGDAGLSGFLPSLTEAGNDYEPSVESESSLFVSVLYADYFDYVFSPNKKWRVFVHKSDVGWNSDIKLEARRTGSGTRVSWFSSNANIHDGTNYREITNNPSFFFRGKHGISTIPISLKFSGFSVIMGAGDFETTLVFTVYDDW
ncbi:hypothetical protein SAMN05444274_106107 [Mariniphaga anaerophila]|uniref:Uncharacterized protein n=1 Tax=Mariniphaga anaerophila TaxID=1484053 RepID=A0A1M5CFW3_9BACT|nr:hypothetical protein [Mariniphaga anaerophila]SHF53635.1 hypothetical protein SAMN05444274_106107 [Mariniphaga anaerophila]